VVFSAGLVWLLPIHEIYAQVWSGLVVTAAMIFFGSLAYAMLGSGGIFVVAIFCVISVIVIKVFEGAGWWFVALLAIVVYFYKEYLKLNTQPPSEKSVASQSDDDSA